MHADLLVESLSEVIAQIVEGVKNTFSLEHMKESLLEVLVGVLSVRLTDLGLWDLQQLLEQHNDELDHLLVLLVSHLNL